MSAADAVQVERLGEVWVVTLARPAVRNAVDAATAAALYQAFLDFEADAAARVAVFHGAHGSFCAGWDLQAGARLAATQGAAAAEVLMAEDFDPADPHARGPMGPSRLRLSKPVIAAVAGAAVAGGMELALWCDLRVAASDATFGVYCRRWGVPLVDGGTIRLPRLIGHSHALDLILTGRGVSGEEAQRMGLANRLVEPGRALDAAVELASELAALPQGCLRSDRRSAHEQWDLPLAQALEHETRLGLEVLRSGESLEGAARFAAGEGRHGQPA